MSRHAVGFTFNTVLASAVSVRVWGIVCVFCVRACVVGWPARLGWLVVLGCFLVLACVYCPECGVVGVGAFLGWV